MPAPQFALLLDGGFVIKKLQRKYGRFPTADDVEKECNRLRSHPSLQDYELLRIYFYHAPPANDELTHPISQASVDLSKSTVKQQHKQLLDALEHREDFALRLGETVTYGWKLGDRATRDLIQQPRALTDRDVIPNVQQKGVDLRIGLDIARLALRGLVRTLVVVTGDSDLVPAFRFARREGLRVYLDHMGHGVWAQLKAHADKVI